MQAQLHASTLEMVVRGCVYARQHPVQPSHHLQQMTKPALFDVTKSANAKAAALRQGIDDARKQLFIFYLNRILCFLSFSLHDEIQRELRLVRFWTVPSLFNGNRPVCLAHAPSESQDKYGSSRLCPDGIQQQ
jgi:hypothetical protein